MRVRCCITVALTLAAHPKTMCLARQMLARQAQELKLTQLDRMSIYDLSPDGGEFRIECPYGSSCLVPSESLFFVFAYGPTDPLVVQQDETSFQDAGATAYYFVGDHGSMGGVCYTSSDPDATTTICNATCDDMCTCVHDPTNVPTLDPQDNSTSFSPGIRAVSSDSSNIMACPVLETFPGAYVATPEERLIYQSSVQAPGFISFRCNDTFATCLQTYRTESMTTWSNYVNTIFPEGGDNYAYARDFQNCQFQGDATTDAICYTACDPRCKCQLHTADAVADPEDCVVGGPPTMAPTILGEDTISPSNNGMASSSSSISLPSWRETISTLAVVLAGIIVSRMLAHAMEYY